VNHSRTGIVIASIAIVLSAARPASAGWRTLHGNTNAATVRVLEGSDPDDSSSRSYFVLEAGDTVTVSLSGEERLRVYAYPVFTDGAYEHFRYGTSFSDEKARHHRRNARGAGDVTLGDGGTVRAGARNSLSLDAPPGAKTFRVWMDAEDGHSALVRVLGLGPDTVRRQSSFGLETRVGVGGYDSNPYLTPSAADTANAKPYWPIAIGADYRADLSRRWEVRGRYDFDGSFYRDTILNEAQHTIDLRERWDRGGRGPLGGAVWTLEQRFRSRNTTFVGRGDEEEYETIADNGDPVPFGDRFDAREARFLADGRFPLSSATELSVATSFLLRDYVEDYTAYPDIYSLDYRRTELDVALAWKVGPSWEIDTAVSLDWKTYKEKFARDADGTQVPGTATSLQQAGVSTEASWEGGGGLFTSFGLAWNRTTDRFAGYWDHDEAVFGTAVGRKWRSGHRVRGQIARSATSYERARLGYTPAGDLREKDSMRLQLDGRVRFRPNVDFEGLLRWDDRNNNSLTFDSSRARLELAVVARR